jgi:uncharacterized protein YaiI (UPF0178 family)
VILLPPVNILSSRYIKFLQVALGFNVADSEIAKRVITSNLVVTGDIPLAVEVIDHGSVCS